MAVDSTLPADKSRVASWPEDIRAIADYVNSLADAVGGDFFRRVITRNVSTTLTPADLDKIIISSSVNPVILILPEVTADYIGRWTRLHRMGSGSLTVAAGGSDVIARGAAGTTITNSLAGEAKAAYIELECTGAGQWIIAGMLGTWS